MDRADLMKSIQAVAVTLEDVEIKATYDNLDKLLACQQALRTILSNLKEEADGNTDSE